MLMPVPLLLRLFYYFPDFPSLIAPEFTLQTEDIVPHIPRINRLLSNLQRNSGVIFNRIELAGSSLGRIAEVRFIGDTFQLN